MKLPFNLGREVALSDGRRGALRKQPRDGRTLIVSGDAGSPMDAHMIVAGGKGIVVRSERDMASDKVCELAAATRVVVKLSLIHI